MGPATVLAAYRIGDSPTNVITPLMVHLPFIVVLSQKYEKDAGVGTVVSLMRPYTVVVLAIVWAAFFALWYLLGIPLGPDATRAALTARAPDPPTSGRLDGPTTRRFGGSAVRRGHAVGSRP